MRTCSSGTVFFGDVGVCVDGLVLVRTHSPGTVHEDVLGDVCFWLIFWRDFVSILLKKAFDRSLYTTNWSEVFFLFVGKDRY